jgi:putative flippase GtrA
MGSRKFTFSVHSYRRHPYAGAILRLILLLVWVLIGQSLQVLFILNVLRLLGHGMRRLRLHRGQVASGTYVVNLST